MKQSFSLSRQERLKSRKLIEQLFSEGKTMSVFPFLLKYMDLPPSAKDPHSSLQMGVTVSKKHFKRAVDRNRIKRLTREAYRLSKQELQQKLENSDKQLLLFFIFTGKELPDFLLVKEKVQVILRKLMEGIDR